MSFQPVKADASINNLMFPIESTCDVISGKSPAFSFPGAVILTTFPIRRRVAASASVFAEPAERE